MEKTKNHNRKNRHDDNQFFENQLGYDEFVETMMMTADEGDLPKVFEHKEPEQLTMNGIKHFSQKFKRDTGLDIEFKLVTCDHCDRLHCLMIVDELPEWKMESDWS